MRKQLWSTTPPIVNLRLTILFIILFLFSCQKDKPMQTSNNGKGIPIQLGKKYNNPYSINNMKQAYSNIYHRYQYRTINAVPTPEQIDSIIVSTNTYIRVLPTNEEDFELLREDSLTEYVDFPLDFTLSEGNYYHDPSLADSVITWQYAVVMTADVPNTGRIRTNNLRTEVLTNDIFLPENSPYYSDFDSTFWQVLESEALNLAGYPTESSAGVPLPRTGIIRIFEELLDRNNVALKTYVPLEGAKILGRNFWRVG